MNEEFRMQIDHGSYWVMGEGRQFVLFHITLTRSFCYRMTLMLLAVWCCEYFCLIFSG